ncbi:MAG TPA: MBL fold metallo-hydrolase [Alphaproteobacteria bacterium]|nr:MBL fold metallo-hydrolase [Alphaproteobacteria bacterium]
MSVTLKICGAARTVTGSCHLFQAGNTKFLVDCGLFQGPKTVKALNYEVFPFNPKDIAFVLLTHAHIDHSGLLPKLVKSGFGGPIVATQGTMDLCSCMLPDSGHIQEMEVEDLNRRNKRRGRPEVTPIYTAADVEATLRAFKPVAYETWVEPAPGIRARYWNAGHILGSASIEIEITEKAGDKPLRILASGDLGSEAKLLQPNPEAPHDLDYVICESTYGGTVRPRVTPEERRQHLAKEIHEAAKRKGALVIPAFAVERTQELLTDILVLMNRGTIPSAPVFLDSPLAIRATEIFLAHADETESAEQIKGIPQSPNLRFTETADESRAIERFRGFHIIIAASGMCDAGRIRHHLRHWLWDERGTVLLVGFQAMGTLGRLLEDGVKAVRIQGEEVRVRAQIRKLDEYSGHADGAELAQWLEARHPIKRGLFLVHGEEANMDSLAARISGRIVKPEALFRPALDDVYELSAVSPKLISNETGRRLAPEAMAHLDWHNELSKLLLDISDRLDKEASDRARDVVIRRLRRSLDTSS